MSEAVQMNQFYDNREQYRHQHDTNPLLLAQWASNSLRIGNTVMIMETY